MKKIAYIIQLIIISITNLSFSQSTQCDWVQKGIGSGDDYSRSVTTDQNGNVIITGIYYSSTISFGTTTLTNGDNSGFTTDIYIVKYDNLGNLLWAKGAGGSSDDNSNSVKCDDLGNIYFIGDFSSSQINFGTTTLNNSGGSKVFIVKLDSQGNEVWVKTSTGNGYDSGKDLVLDANNNVIITGEFNGSTFGVGTASLTNFGFGSDFFIAKYDSSGNFSWAKSGGDSSDESSKNITVDALNNIYIAGYFKSVSIAFGTTTLTNADNFNNRADIFLAKYDPSGTVVWAKRAGGTSTDEANSIGVDSENSVYIIGNFSSNSIDFGTTNLVNSSNANFSTDFFIAKFDTQGNSVWAKRAGDTSFEGGVKLVVDNNDNLFVTGTFDGGTLNFGSGNIPQIGSMDVFLVKYDKNGNNILSYAIASNNLETSSGIALDNDGNLFLTGNFYSSLTFGTNNIQLTNSNSTGEVFIAKFKTDYVSINEISDENFLVYPNPSKGIFSFDLMQDCQIIITNSLGNEVLNIVLEEGKNEVNLMNEANGVYFVTLLYENDNKTLKIVKQ